MGSWILLKKQPALVNQESTLTKGADQFVPKPLGTNLAAIATFSNSPVALQGDPKNELFNALTATNLGQWKAMIKDLQKLGGFEHNQCWVMEGQISNAISKGNLGRYFILNQNGQTVKYNATFIVLTTKDYVEDLLEVEMQTVNMNIEETRELGLQLCRLLGTDSTEFIAWCAKVGNHWLSAPLYGTRSNVPLSFKILMTYDDLKPWSIYFTIQ